MSKEWIDSLVQQMTLDEKLGEMTQLAPEFLGVNPSMDLTGPMSELNLKEEWIPMIGSTLNGFGAEKLKALQEKHMQENRLHIPLLFMADVIHGYQTTFPIPLAIGCSFNPDNYELASHIAGVESAATGIHLTFAPMTDLVRDPRWGRVMESTGEDAYLNSKMTAAAVRGFQGDDLKEKGRIAACVKHFAAYGAPSGGRDYNTVDMSEGMLREYYLPAYKAAVDANVAMVMTAFNTVDRVPCSANKWLMRDVLRGEWGFDGVVISDYAAVNETITHGVSADSAEAAEKCLKAGVDIEMMSSHYYANAHKLLEEGKLDMSLIDDAVTRILELKDALGLFENPYKDASAEDEQRLFQCDEHMAAAQKIASECAVLLKNNGVLPLQKPAKIGLAGPFADSVKTLGGWSAGKVASDASLYASLKNVLPETEFTCAMTGELGAMQAGIMDVEDKLSELQALADCDVIIAAVGENSEDTGEGASKAYLHLSTNQERMLYALKALGKPVVMVVFSGRPLELYPVLDCADAVLQGWYLGSKTGPAVADILTGAVNPSGRLSMSFPYTAGQIPVHYNMFQTGRPYEGKPDRYISRYLDCPTEALFPFGYGLSYSEFEYRDFGVELCQGADGIVAKASVTVKNTSEVTGKETVQLYIRDVKAQVTRPLKELKGFKQVVLAPGEEARVTFEVTKEMLSYWNNNSEFIFEAGEFELMIGRSSAETEGVRVRIA